MSLLSRYLDQTEFSSYDDFVRNFRLRVPSGFNFAYDVVDVYARAHPGKRALLWCDDHGGERSFTFADLSRLSHRTAVFLRDQGIGRGDAVMLILKGRYEFWWFLLALHRLGAIAVPATHMLKAKDIAYRIHSADLRAVVCLHSGGLLEEIEAAQDECADIPLTKIAVGGTAPGWVDFEDELAATPRQATIDPPSLGPDETMLLYFTSGTTGLPKMVGHTFSYPLGHITTAKYWQNVEPDGLHYTVADTGWAKAVWGKIYGQWLAGSAVLVYDYDRFSGLAMLEKALQHGVTSFCAPPTVYRFLVKEDISACRNSSLRYCVVAGEPLNPEIYRKFLDETGIRLMEGYGQTELTITIATWPWDKPKPGSMGKPAPGYDIELIKPDGTPAGTGEEGEIVVNTENGTPVGMFRGYCRDEELTRRVWHENRYHTGDIAWKDADGYFWFVGRVDDVIKSAGYRIGPFEVESALMRHPAVLECAVTGVPDTMRGSLVKATVVVAPGFDGSDALRHALQQHVKAVTAPYKYPREVEFVDELPKTISGKIRRKEIRARDRDFPLTVQPSAEVGEASGADCE